jgi:hypothetical protein
MDVLMNELEKRVFFICKNVFRKSHLDILYSLSRLMLSDTPRGPFWSFPKHSIPFVMFSMLESRSIGSKHVTIGYQ